MPLCSLHIKHFEDLPNLFKALNVFILKISPYKCHLYLTHAVFTFIVERGKSSYASMTEKYDAIITKKLLKSVNECV